MRSIQYPHLAIRLSRGLSLLLCGLLCGLLAACDNNPLPTTPASADTQKSPSQYQPLKASSQQGFFTASLYQFDPDAADTQRKPNMPIGQFTNWLLELKDQNGNAIYPATISIGGGMPAHGHGSASQPQVGPHRGNGQYLIEGLKFNMSGKWVLQMAIRSQSQQDRIEFVFNVSH